jgi:hypothetical protein
LAASGLWFATRYTPRPRSGRPEWSMASALLDAFEKRKLLGRANL